jgi:hypothetical protein
VTRNEAGAPPGETVVIGAFRLTATDVTVPQWDNRRPTRAQQGDSEGRSRSSAVSVEAEAPVAP